MATMTEHNHKYQAMFLLDNEEVRQGFNAARDWVRATLEKHGLTVHVLRLWGERPLAYQIGGRRRATYLLGWLEGSGDAINNARRELYLLGPAFRCLFLEQDEIPADEMSQGIPELKDSDLIIPEEIDQDLLDEMVEVSAETPDEEEEGASRKVAPAAKTEAPAAKTEAPAAKEEAPAKDVTKETASTGGTESGN